MNDFNNIYYFYSITNTINDSIYIGSTKNPRARWYKHRQSANSNTMKRCSINKLMLELGVDNFNMNILESGLYETDELAHQREDELMEEYDAIDPKCVNTKCASKKKGIANSKRYDKAYNNKQSTKDAKKLWNAENRERVNRNQIEASKRYNENNKERLAYNRVIKYELDNYGKTSFDFTLFT